MPGPVRTAVTRFSPCKMTNTLKKKKNDVHGKWNTVDALE